MIRRTLAAAVAVAAAQPSAPSPAPPPDGATVATSFEALQDLILRRDGPRQIVLAAGRHRGDLVIDRAVSIRGEAGAELEGSGAGTVVTIDASDVVVEDLVVRRSGRRHTSEDAGIKAKGERVRVADVRIEDTLFGITLEGCRSCTVERVRVIGSGDEAELRGDAIKLWEAHDSVVRGCLVERSRDVVVWYTRRALLEDNVVRKSRYGSHFMYAHDGIVRNSRLEGNVVGLFVMYSMRLTVEGNVLAGARGAAGVGVGLKDSDAVAIRGNWMVANTTGAYLDDTPRTPDQAVTFERNVVALNDVGMRLHTAEDGLHVRGNDFRDNAMLVEVDGGGDALAVDVRGNHFSDYEGYDLDGDGIGDVAHEVKKLSSELTEAHPALKLFHGTAAMGVIDAVAHATPVLASKRLLVDAAPLVDPPPTRSP